MGNWEDNDFSNADDIREIAYTISYWRVVKRDCDGCSGDYVLQNREFDHVLKTNNPAADYQKALDILALQTDHKRNLTGKNPELKGLSLHINKVMKIERISDFNGDIIPEADRVDDNEGRN